MLERDVERQLKKAVEGMGGMCLKFVSPGYAGVPDRLIILPGGKVCFAEVKRPGEQERPLQHYVQTRLRHMGCTVYASVDGPEALARVVEDCRRLAHAGL